LQANQGVATPAQGGGFYPNPRGGQAIFTPHETGVAKSGQSARESIKFAGHSHSKQTIASRLSPFSRPVADPDGACCEQPARWCMTASPPHKIEQLPKSNTCFTFRWPRHKF
jgi:hypothetical protein